jgi:hypothetical protein
MIADRSPTFRRGEDFDSIRCRHDRGFGQVCRAVDIDQDVASRLLALWVWLSCAART